MPSPFRVCHRIGLQVLALLTGLMSLASPAGAEDPVQPKPPIPPAHSKRKPVKLWPPPADERPFADLEPGKSVELDGWTYTARRSGKAADDVPWELLVVPSPSNAAKWRRGEGMELLARLAPKSAGSGPVTPESVPVAEFPDGFWKQRMAPDFAEVVGVHFHELTAETEAHILFTLHKVPPDGPDGKAPKEYAGIPGTRIEATLVAPVIFNLDQSVIAREDPNDKSASRRRAEHELGHAKVSQEIVLPVLAGLQDWDLAGCKGNRTRVTYYWRRERAQRTWHGYGDADSQIASLRTSIALVPPTRWSRLLPIPPERITQKHIQQFNDYITTAVQRFAFVDEQAQARFHAQHGEYDAAPEPRAEVP